MDQLDSKYRRFVDSLHVGSDTEVIKNLDAIGSNFDPNIAVYRSGDTIIHILARLGRTSILLMLVERFSSVLNLESTNLEGKRPLHEAAQYGKYETVKLLLTKAVEVDPIKRADWTPLMLAATKVGSDALKVIRILLEQGNANAGLQNKDGWNTFHLAAREGNLDILNLIFEKSPTSCVSKSKNGRTPAHTAALHARLETLKFLSEKCGQSLNEIDSCGATPLIDSARAGHVEVVSYLIEGVGCDPYLLDKMGRNVLSVSAHSGVTKVVNYLVRCVSMDPNTITGRELKMAPIHWCAKEGHLETIEYLVNDLKADPNLTDSRGRTALHLAMGGNYLLLTKYLLKHVEIFDMKLLDAASLSPEMCSLIESTFGEWNMKLYIPTFTRGTIYKLDKSIQKRGGRIILEHT